LRVTSRGLGDVYKRQPTDLAKWCIRFQIDKEELILKSMKLETIILAIRKTLPETFIIYTPENMETVFLRCYMRNSAFKQTESFYDECVIPLMNKIKNVIVRGIEGLISTSVIDAVKTVEKPDGTLELSKIFAIAAVGTNLVAAMLDPYIDPYRTQSDSIEEIERIFGLAAARNKIINELAMASVELNRYHCSIFADEMCYSGVVSSIQKTGLQKRENANITLRLSFQTPIQVITESAINGMCDSISGISGPLIMGTNPRIGTCYNTVCLNEEFIKQNTVNIDNLLEEL
jgi:DNA-directed RNA polymerase II subunit RPB1